MEIALSNWTIYRYNSAGIKISRLMTIYRLVAMLHVRQSQRRHRTAKANFRAIANKAIQGHLHNSKTQSAFYGMEGLSW